MKLVQVREEDTEYEGDTYQTWCDTLFNPERNLAELAAYHNHEYRLIEILATAKPKPKPAAAPENSLHKDAGWTANGEKL